MKTDKERLDFLERLYQASANGSDYSRVVLRMSTTGRGFRLHSCRPGTWEPNCLSVREAIDVFINEAEK